MTTLFQKLQAANLPISEATEGGAISGMPGVVMTQEQEETVQEIIREHFGLPEPMPSTEERLTAIEDAVLAQILGG
jgi:hypothetical protein